MAFSKVIQIGTMGSLALSEGAGVATVKVSVGEAVGGGSAAGVAKVSASAEIDISDAQLAGLLFDYIAVKVPALSAILMDAKAAAIAAL